MRRIAPLIALLLASCLSNPFPTEPSDPATETFAPSLGVDIKSMQKTALGVYYRDSVVGSGAVVVDATPRVVYEWVGYLKDATNFGFNTAGGDTVAYANGLLPSGIKDGLLGMREGGKRLIVVPSALAYGSSGAGVVPPNATIVVSIHLLTVLSSAPAP